MGGSKMIAAGGRSERSERRAPAAGMAVEPELTPIAGRRRFTASHKFQILEEADQCKWGELALLLQREGLYPSTIVKWRIWRKRMSDEGLEPSAKGESERELRKEIEKVRRENQRLKLKLMKTQGLIELQKKAFELLEGMNQNDEHNGSN